jgi:predicted metal-binding protein
MHYRKYFDQLVDLEGDIFKDGFYKAFLYLAGPCRMCRPCAIDEKKSCNFPDRAGAFHGGFRE